MDEGDTSGKWNFTGFVCNLSEADLGSLPWPNKVPTLLRCPRSLEKRFSRLAACNMDTALDASTESEASRCWLAVWSLPQLLLASDAEEDGAAASCRSIVQLSGRGWKWRRKEDEATCSRSSWRGPSLRDSAPARRPQRRKGSSAPWGRPTMAPFVPRSGCPGTTDLL